MNIVTKNYQPSGDTFLDSQVFGREIYLTLRKMIADQGSDRGVIQFLQCTTEEVLDTIVIDAHVNITATSESMELEQDEIPRRELLEKIVLGLVRRGHLMWVCKIYTTDDEF